MGPALPGLNWFQHLPTLAPSQCLLWIGPSTHPQPELVPVATLNPSRHPRCSEVVTVSSLGFSWAQYSPELVPAPSPATPPAPLTARPLPGPSRHRGEPGLARGRGLTPGAWPAAGRAAPRRLSIGADERPPANDHRPGGVAWRRRK